MGMTESRLNIRQAIYWTQRNIIEKICKTKHRENKEDKLNKTE